MSIINKFVTTFYVFIIVFNIRPDNIDEEFNYEDEYNKNIEEIDLFKKNKNIEDTNKNKENITIEPTKDNNDNAENNKISSNNITNAEKNIIKLDIEKLNISKKVIINDKFSRILRLFISCGFILDPTVKIYKEKIKKETREDFEINILSGIRLAVDYIPTNVINKYLGLTRKYRLSYAKLKDSEFFTIEGLKNDYSNYILGIQGEIGISLPLNIRYNMLDFNNDNNINKNIHSINILGGLKFEIGDFDSNPQYVKNIFPTKLVFELMYILDLKKWFSFYISSSFYQCFSPVYLLSFNLKDLQNTLNTSNKFQWNFDITIGLIGLNFPT